MKWRADLYLALTFAAMLAAACHGFLAFLAWLDGSPVAFGMAIRLGATCFTAGAALLTGWFTLKHLEC